MTTYEPDSFDNDPQVQQWRKERLAYQQMIEDAISIICTAFNAQKSSHRNVKEFLLHKSIEIPFINASYSGRLSNRDFHICLIEYRSTVRTARTISSGSDEYFAGVIQLSQPYPHTIIQPETLAKKIEDLFTKSDVDFTHAKKFSRKFYVITKDKTKLEFLLANKDLNRLANFPEAEMELNGNKCYFRANRKAVSEEEAKQFEKLAKMLFELF